MTHPTGIVAATNGRKAHGVPKKAPATTEELAIAAPVPAAATIFVIPPRTFFSLRSLNRRESGNT